MPAHINVGAESAAREPPSIPGPCLSRRACPGEREVQSYLGRTGPDLHRAHRVLSSLPAPSSHCFYRYQVVSSLFLLAVFWGSLLVLDEGGTSKGSAAAAVKKKNKDGNEVRGMFVFRFLVAVPPPLLTYFSCPFFWLVPPPSSAVVVFFIFIFVVFLRKLCSLLKEAPRLLPLLYCSCFFF